MKKPAIILKTNDFCVVDKPHAWLSVPSRHAMDDPRPCLGLWLQSHLETKVWPVHRLDFEVSGVTLFALNSEAHREASLAFERRQVEKTYEAWSQPGPSEPPLNEPQMWRCILAKGKRRAFEAPWGKPSETSAIWMGDFSHRTMSDAKDLRLWKWLLSPKTGRSHQLRFEMARHQTPILGDVLYGGQAIASQGTVALRAVSLTLPIELSSNWGIPPRTEVSDLSTAATI